MLSKRKIKAFILENAENEEKERGVIFFMQNFNKKFV